MSLCHIFTTSDLVHFVGLLTIILKACNAILKACNASVPVSANYVNKVLARMLTAQSKN